MAYIFICNSQEIQWVLLLESGDNFRGFSNFFKIYGLSLIFCIVADQLLKKKIRFHINFWILFAV
jgi:hypothetical protein